MQSPSDIVPFIFYIITFVAGLLGNMSILTLNILDWMKSLDLTSCDLIVSGLGVSNICLQFAFFASYLCSLINLEFFQRHAVQYFLTSKCFFDLLSLWITTWLCLYYCVRIVNCSWPPFLWVKEKFSKMVPWLILYSTIVSLAISLPRIWDFLRVTSANSTLNISSNSTPTNQMTDSSSNILFVTHLTVSLLAFTGMVLSAVIIITSLHMHMKKMARGSDGFRSPQTDAHLGAIKTVSLLLILYILFYTSQSFLILRVVKRGEKAYIACTCVVSIFPTLNSLILIMGSSRLKNGLVQALLHVK
ncbi:taste receptor type 2 member 7-like [Ambystoma mexicanum]|uniref:taste receptor type 2 member 7-like n=1 Tax=Ambystoma mexicanum TaxID=8296 RepID=UPI0037E7F393